MNRAFWKTFYLLYCWTGGGLKSCFSSSFITHKKIKLRKNIKRHVGLYIHTSCESDFLWKKKTDTERGQHIYIKAKNLIKARCLTAEYLSPSPAAIFSQTGFLAGSVILLSRWNLDGFTVWFLTNVINVAIMLDDYLFIHLLFISMQYHNYISAVYRYLSSLYIDMADTT